MRPSPSGSRSWPRASRRRSPMRRCSRRRNRAGNGGGHVRSNGVAARRQAVKISPEDAGLRTRLRQALLARGVTPSLDRAEARVCFKEASQLNADDPRVWQALAKLADTPAESVEALRQLLRVAPDTP